MATKRVMAAVKTKETSQKTNTNKMCRLCLKPPTNENLLNIFDSSTETSLIMLRIMACTGLEVSSQDALPKRICLDCRLQLEKSFLFRIKSINSDAKLRRYFRLINAGKASHVFDDSEDECDDEYTESMKIIRQIEKRLIQKRKATNDEEIRQAIEAETKRIYTKAKESFDEQLQRALKRTEKRIFIPAEMENPSPKRQRHSISERRQSCHSEISNQLDDDMIKCKENDDLLQSHGDDDSNNEHDNESVRDYTDIVEYALTKDDELEEDDGDDNDKNAEFELSESRRRKSDEKDVRISESSSTVLEADDITLSTDYADLEEFPGSIEYLEEECDPNENDDAFDIDAILPAIKKSIVRKSGVYLDEHTKYTLFRKPDNEIEVECTTSDGKVFSVEIVIGPLQHISTTLQNAEKDESGELKHEAPIKGYLRCPHCSKSFPSNSTLTRHIRIHTGERPFKCAICNRAFVQKEILKRHETTHASEREFKCDVCQKSFILKEALKQHINRNHLENPIMEFHTCPLCPKTFCHSSGLSRHMLIHAGRRFACELCKKAFNDGSALKRHVTTMHNARTPKNQKKIDGQNESKVKPRTKKSK